MQWVVTTGDTVEEARERALDALGIDEADLEVEVLSEPSTSWWGLRRVDARVRARVRPTAPRPKIDRRKRRSRRDGAGRSRRRGGQKQQSGNQKAKQPGPSPADASPEPPKRAPAAPRPAAAPAAAAAPEPDRTTQSPAARAGRGAAMSDIPLTEQEPTAVDFVRGLVAAFGLDAEVQSTHLDEDDAVEIQVDGADLGLLVGQRGATLGAIAELTRTAVAQQHSGRLEGRLRVDIAGYRARRKEALVRFATQVADKVKESGAAVALEPMSPPDRKIVHDAINDIEGVHTSSRGEDRRRHVVVHPD